MPAETWRRTFPGHPRWVFPHAPDPVAIDLSGEPETRAPQQLTSSKARSPYFVASADRSVRSDARHVPFVAIDLGDVGVVFLFKEVP